MSDVCRQSKFVRMTLVEINAKDSNNYFVVPINIQLVIRFGIRFRIMVMLQPSTVVSENLENEITLIKKYMCEK